MCETRVQSLGREDTLEKEMATHSNILAWRITRTEKPGGLQSMRLQRVRHVWATNIFTGNYDPTCHRPDQKKKRRRRQQSGYSWFVIGFPLSGHWSPGSSFYALPSECMSSRVTVPSQKREKDHKGTLCERFGCWLGNGTHHSNYKEAGKSGLGADPRRGNGLNCTTFTVNYFGCQVQAENVNLRLCLNCNWDTSKKIFNLSESQVFFSLEQLW